MFFGGACDCESDPQSIHHVGLMLDSGYNMWNALKTGTKVRKDNFKDWDENACPFVIRFEELVTHSHWFTGEANHLDAGLAGACISFVVDRSMYKAVT